MDYQANQDMASYAEANFRRNAWKPVAVTKDYVLRYQFVVAFCVTCVIAIAA